MIAAWIKRLLFAPRCPTCDCNLFHEGPHGGEAINVRCAQCGAFWWYGGPFGFKPITSEPDLYAQRARPMEELI